ncbi:hypothetical protein [Pedobacter mucosus]|uniref:hypothetical protein n=1 Tax=Pedobacter mucosus TaxID=2895286 RepID=UPI001EE4B7EF|nr:hypothetical protein [Pedobacter mucosus]UKT62245.1 hypothetical protein LOK61_10775 [Pedobacter mucosus]
MSLTVNNQKYVATERITIPLQKTLIGTGFLEDAIFWSKIILAVAIGFQCYFFWEEANLAAIAYVAVAWLILTTFFMTEGMLKKYPLSALIIIGFTSTQFYFPLLFTSMEFKPLVYNLDLPYEVFFHSAAALAVLFLAHYLYRFLPTQTQRSNSILKKLGFFTPPTDMQLWLMGGLGLLANIYGFVYTKGSASDVTGSAADKIIQALYSFSYAPFFIPFKALFGSSKKTPKSVITWLIVFTIALFAISMARNSRGVFMLGFTSLGFSYMLGLLLGIFKVPVVNLKIVVISTVLIWLLLGPFSDLGTAMLIVRGERNDISKTELIQQTIVAFQNKEAIRAREAADKVYVSDWDEKYLDNIFTARFANIKFNDASLVQGRIIGDNNPDMRSFTINYVWGALPEPVLKLVKPDVDKEMLYAQSFGDYIYSLAGAGKSSYGGFRVGHISGTGMAGFGWWYLAILGFSMVPVFLLFDKLSIKGNLRYYRGKITQRNTVFSVCGLLALTSVFQYLPTESVAGPFTFLIRGYLQMLLLYILLFHITKYIASLLSKVYE